MRDIPIKARYLMIKIVRFKVLKILMVKQLFTKMNNMSIGNNLQAVKQPNNLMVKK
jgi:hypothetical protein